MEHEIVEQFYASKQAMSVMAMKTMDKSLSAVLRHQVTAFAEFPMSRDVSSHSEEEDHSSSSLQRLLDTAAFSRQDAIPPLHVYLLATMFRRSCH